MREVFSIITSISTSGYLLEKWDKNFGNMYSPIVKLAPIFILPLTVLESVFTSRKVTSKRFIISLALLYKV